MALPALIAAPAHGHDFQGPAIHVGHPWAYPTPGTDAAVVFLALVNRGPEPDRLTAAECPRARRAMLLEYPPGGGAVRVMSGFDLPPNAPLALRPGRRHIRLQQLDRPFMIGDRVPLTLIFARAGRMSVEVVVENEGSH